jgi:hypothetical protein
VRRILFVPQVAPYIPNRQADFTAWLANFSTLITAAPATYGLLAADATIIAGYNTTWVAAYTPVTSKNTKTAAAVAAKNTQYAALLPLIRAYAQQVSNNVGVSSAAKIALGLNPKTSTPSPISPPASTPVLLIQYTQLGQVVLRYRDSAASVSSKGKPYGVKRLRLLGGVSTTPVTDPTKLPFLTVATKSPFVLSTAGLVSGGTLYLSGQWETQRGQTSGYASIISVTVP